MNQDGEGFAIEGWGLGAEGAPPPDFGEQYRQLVARNARTIIVYTQPLAFVRGTIPPGAVICAQPSR